MFWVKCSKKLYLCILPWKTNYMTNLDSKVKTPAIMNIFKNSSILMRHSLFILETTFCKFKSELSRGNKKHKYWYATPLNLRCRKSSILVIHIFRFWGSVFLNQTRVLSTWLSGGMGRNPRPGYNQIMIQTKPHQTLDLHFTVIRNYTSLKILCYEKQMISFISFSSWEPIKNCWFKSKEKYMILNIMSYN